MDFHSLRLPGSGSPINIAVRDRGAFIRRSRSSHTSSGITLDGTEASFGLSFMKALKRSRSMRDFADSLVRPMVDLNAESGAFEASNWRAISSSSFVHLMRAPEEVHGSVQNADGNSWIVAARIDPHRNSEDNHRTLSDRPEPLLHLGICNRYPPIRGSIDFEPGPRQTEGPDVLRPARIRQPASASCSSSHQ